MANDWILDVLRDLTTFAEKNGLPALERQLIAASDTALLELETGAGLPQNVAPRGIHHAGILHRLSAEGPNA